MFMVRVYDSRQNKNVETMKSTDFQYVMWFVHVRELYGYDCTVYEEDETIEGWRIIG